jgi:hypothetical protein
MVPIDFIQLYRVPANNGDGFSGQLVHWQAYYQNGVKKRRGITLAKIYFNTDGTGKLYATWTPDGKTDLYTNERLGGNADQSSILVKNCSAFSDSRELWPASQAIHQKIKFNDAQLFVTDQVQFGGYQRTSFWAFRAGSTATELFFRISLALPTNDPTNPFRWYSRVEPANTTWATNTLLVAEGFMRQYANASVSRWGRALFAPVMGAGVWNLFQGSNHYAIQNVTPGQVVIGSAMLLASMLFYVSLDTNLWTTHGNASTQGDRIAIHFSTQSGLDASNNLVADLFQDPFSGTPLNSRLMFTNTITGLNTAELWTGPTNNAGQNPANTVGSCNTPYGAF